MLPLFSASGSLISIGDDGSRHLPVLQRIRGLTNAICTQAAVPTGTGILCCSVCGCGWTGGRTAHDPRRASSRRPTRDHARTGRVVRRHPQIGSQRSNLPTATDSVLYFSDAVFHPEIGEGSTWVWHDDGQPQAIAQIYFTPNIDQWAVGLYTFSSDRLTFDDHDTIQREYRPTDFDPQPVPNAPAPADTAAARLRQLRQLARRFSAYERRPLRKDRERSRTELRLLPQPIHRYACESAGPPRPGRSQQDGREPRFRLTHKRCCTCLGDRFRVKFNRRCRYQRPGRDCRSVWQPNPRALNPRGGGHRQRVSWRRRSYSDPSVDPPTCHAELPARQDHSTVFDNRSARCSGSGNRWSRINV